MGANELGHIEKAELGVAPTAFACQINVPPNRISQIISGKRSITGATALRFGRWFSVESQFWLNSQTQYDLANVEKPVGAEIRGLPAAANL